MVNSPKLRSLILLTTIAGAAPLLMAPSDPGCIECIQIAAWAGSLSARGNVTHVATVSGGVVYHADLVASSGATLVVSGNSTNLSCSTAGNNTYCEFKAVNNGTVDLKVVAGNEATHYTLYHMLP